MEQKLAIEDGPLDDHFKSYQVSFQVPFHFQNLHPLARNVIALVVDNGIYVWNGDNLTAIETPLVFGSRLVGDRLYLATCDEPPPLPGRCHIAWTDFRLAMHEIRSSPYSPYGFQTLGDGSVIVDEWGQGLRRIVKAGPAPGHETILWSETEAFGGSD